MGQRAAGVVIDDLNDGARDGMPIWSLGKQMQ